MIGLKPRRARLGLTLIELMVVLGIISILAGLLLPAVQAAREAARRATCGNNMRQVILATQGFASDRNGFPGAVTWGANFASGLGRLASRPKFWGSAHCQVLPHLERGAVFNAINFDIPYSILSTLGPANVTAASTSISAFLCPSDGLAWTSPQAGQSYRINQGLGEFQPTIWHGRPALAFVDTGAFGRANQVLQLAEFADGLSNTIAYAEKKVGSGPGPFNPSRDYITVSESGALAADDWLKTCANLVSTEGAATDAGRCWLLHGAQYSAFFASAPPNSRVPDCGGTTDNGIGVFAARSDHPGGVQVALADGSVRFVRSSVDLATWRASGTRASGEVFASPW